MTADADGRRNFHIAWIAPDRLQVTVGNLVSVRSLTTHVDGIDIDLRFDPDDPVARAAWMERVRNGTFYFSSPKGSALRQDHE